MAKGQGISINVIIIAAIALLVLVVLSVLFLGRVGIFGVKTIECAGQGGLCAIDQCSDGRIEYTAWTCPETAGGATQICCIAPGTAI